MINPTANSVLDPWFERVGYETGIENLGEKGAWVGIGPSNATVAASPLAYYKFHANEGGLRVPLVMSGPGISQRGELSDEIVFVTDLAPTILSLVEVNDHGGSWHTREVEPIVGKDFSAYLEGQLGPIHPASEPIGYEMGGSGALFKGDYKIVINKFEQSESEWHLFNIKTDPGETNDLAQVEPELLAEMLDDYEEWASINNVLPMPEGYNRGRTILPGFRR